MRHTHALAAVWPQAQVVVIRILDLVMAAAQIQDLASLNRESNYETPTFLRRKAQ